MAGSPSKRPTIDELIQHLRAIRQEVEAEKPKDRMEMCKSIHLASFYCQMILHSWQLRCQSPIIMAKLPAEEAEKYWLRFKEMVLWLIDEDLRLAEKEASLIMPPAPPPPQNQDWIV